MACDLNEEGEPGLGAEGLDAPIEDHENPGPEDGEHELEVAAPAPLAAPAECPLEPERRCSLEGLVAAGPEVKTDPPAPTRRQQLKDMLEQLKKLDCTERFFYTGHLLFS